MISWISAIIVGLAIFIGIGARLFWPSFAGDTVIEHVAEEVIQEETGVHVDLSPESSDKK